MSFDSYARKLIEDSLNEPKEITAKKQASFVLMDQYLKRYGEGASEDDHNLVPPAFIKCQDWDKKNHILKEALDQNLMIKDRPLFLEIVE